MFTAVYPPGCSEYIITAEQQITQCQTSHTHVKHVTYMSIKAARAGLKTQGENI